jgi:2-hydroxy-3-oxopropionate reductase
MSGVVSFIGLGVMGRPMAKNLGDAGFEVVAYTRSGGSRDRARTDGIHVVDAIGDLPSSPDFVITVLPDASDVEDVLFGAGVHAASGSSALFIDMSTIAPERARAIAERIGSSGARFLDAPVSGGEAGAVAASLSIMVGGAAEDVDRASGAFDAMGKMIVHVGAHGAGQVTKAANQMIVAGNLAILGEALVFLEEHGLDSAVALSVIGGGLAGSTVLERKSSAMLAGDYTPGFRLSLHAKDLGIVGRAAADRGIPLTVTSAVTQIVRSLVATGRGGLDHSALYLASREAAGPVARRS